MISPNLIALIKQSEGFSATPYQDSVGVWTIGYGFTHFPNGNPVTKDTPNMPVMQANEVLEELLSQFTNGVNAMTQSVSLNQNQKDALLDFAYNLGLGSLKGSTLLKLVLANPDDSNITAQFMAWVHGGGRVLPGLVTRRAAEAKLYFTPIQQA